MRAHLRNIGFLPTCWKTRLPLRDLQYLRACVLAAQECACLRMCVFLCVHVCLCVVVVVEREREREYNRHRKARGALLRQFRLDGHFAERAANPLCGLYARA